MSQVWHGFARIEEGYAAPLQPQGALSPFSSSPAVKLSRMANQYTSKDIGEVSVLAVKFWVWSEKSFLFLPPHLPCPHHLQAENSHFVIGCPENHCSLSRSTLQVTQLNYWGFTSRVNSNLSNTFLILHIGKLEEEMGYIFIGVR